MNKIRIILFINIVFFIISCNKENSVYTSVKTNRTVVNETNYKGVSLHKLYYHILDKVSFHNPDSITFKQLEYYTEVSLKTKDSLNIYRSNNLSIRISTNIPLQQNQINTTLKSVKYFDHRNLLYDSYYSNLILAEYYLSIRYYKIAENFIYNALEKLDKFNNDFAYEKILASMTAANILYSQLKDEEAYRLIQSYNTHIKYVNKEIFSKERINFITSLYYNNNAVVGVYTNKITYKESNLNYHKALKLVSNTDMYDLHRGNTIFNIFSNKIKNNDTDSIDYYYNLLMKLQKPYLDLDFIQGNLRLFPLYYLDIKKDTVAALALQKKILKDNEIYKNDYLEYDIYEQLITKNDSFSEALYHNFLKSLSKIEKQNDLNEKSNQKTVYENYKLIAQTHELKKSNLIFFFIMCCLMILLAVVFINYMQRIRLKKASIKNTFLEQDHKAFEIALNYKNETEEKLSEAKNDIIMELHDGIVNKLFSTRFLLHKNLIKPENFEIAKNTLEAVNNNLSNISNNYFAINEIGNKKSFKILIEELIILQPSEKITFKLIVEESIDSHYISPKIKFHTYRILQEIIQNVHKHSQADRSIIKIVTRKNNLVIRTHDNGIGINLEKNKGIGMENINKRLIEINGKIQIYNRRGTFLLITIPY